MASRPLMGGVPTGQIWLQGRSLPYRPIVFKGKQRVKTTWLPGNPVATQQVMGPTEEPTTINGTWKDRFLGNGVAMDLANLFQDLRRTGPLVEVSWGAGIVDGSVIGTGIVRQGIITDSEFTIDRPQDVQWRIEFTWRGDNQAVAPGVLTVGVENPRQGFANVKQSLQDVLDNLAGFEDSPLSTLVQLPGKLRADIDSTAKQMEAVIALVQDGAGLGTSLVDLPSVVALRATQVASKGATVAGQVRDLVLSIDPLYKVPFDSALDFLTFQDQQFVMTHACDSAQETSLSTVNALIGQTQPDIIAEVRPPPGTDLRDLALTFYGDPDLWGIIAQYNGLSGSSVPSPPTGPSDNPAPAIQIPRRITGALGQFNC